MKKMLILFRGPCGAGKTYIRSRMGIKKVKGYDMADMDLATPISDRVQFPAIWLKKHKAEKILWIEGIFAPLSPSLELLLLESRLQKRSIQDIVVNADLEILKERIGKDPGRMKLALMYQHRFDGGSQ